MRERKGERESKRMTAAILADGGSKERKGGEGRMRVEWGDRGVSIDPQNTLPHVESIRNNLVFYPPLQKKGGFSGALCV